MARLQDRERELHDAILALQKDVQGHKKEIRDREETVVDKEARIYDLKKKNQELEKFKFVLNYKIQVRHTDSLCISPVLFPCHRLFARGSRANRSSSARSFPASVKSKTCASK
jgi:hypothetical protein